MHPPMVDHDLFGVNLKKVEAASPCHQPDDPIAIVRGQLPEAL